MLGKDIVAPVISLSNSGWINQDTQSSHTVTGTCTDAKVASLEERSVLADHELLVLRQAGGTFSTSINYSGVSDGNNNISIISNISDAAGNVVQDGITLSKDTVDPVITLSNNGNIVN